MQITKITNNYFVSPQLRPEDMAKVAEAGFRTIVNNRPDGEEAGQPASAQIRAEAERLRLIYHDVLVAPGADASEAARRLTDILEREPAPVLAFCRSGTRSTGLFNLARGGR